MSSSRPAAERLFFALWPDDPVRERLNQISEAAAIVGGRRIAAHNLHVTLSFLGNVEIPRRALIEERIDRLSAAYFSFSLTEIEWRRRTGILWLTATQPPHAMLDLVTALQQIFVDCGGQMERRAYRAHVTLARDVRRGPRRQPIEPIVWEAREVALVSSRQTPAGSEYRVERRWPLS